MDSQISQSVQGYHQLEQMEHNMIKEFLKENEYEYQQVLGKGDYSQVIKAFSKKHQCQVAIKVLNQCKVQKRVDLKEFEKEIEVLQKLKNEKYVLQIIEKIQDDQKGLAAIVTELCDCDLTKIFDLNKFKYEQVLVMAYQFLKGLLVLQEKGIIHSDIKPDNILFSKSKNQFLIADYGLSKILADPSSQKTMSSLKGNVCYKSPEVRKKQKPYTIKVDVFSVGQLLIEVFIQRKLEEDEWHYLKSESLFTVLPFLKDSEHFKFIDKILSKMVDPNQNTRLEPKTLLQYLNSFEINEDCLKQLKLSQEPRILYIKNINIEDIINAIDYDILKIDLRQIIIQKLNEDIFKQLKDGQFIQKNSTKKD